MTIKWHQGYQNTPCGVYSHMMSTVQCNSMDPAARDGGLMIFVTIMERWKSSSAGSIMSLQRESWSSSHTRSCAPEKLFLKEVSVRAWTGVAVSSSQLISHLGQYSWKCNLGLAGLFCYIHMHLKNIQGLWQRLKTVSETRTCSQQSLR